MFFSEEKDPKNFWILTCLAGWPIQGLALAL
jgi:hypothetical protein